LERGCLLINGGASGMSESFYRLQALSEEQQDCIEQLSALLTESASRVSEAVEQQISSFTQQINSAQGRAIQSLQFEDMTTQSLQSMAENVSQLEKISKQLTLMSSSSLPFEQQLIELENVCNSVTHQGLQPSHHRTVAQKNMDEGEVELF